jgi:hypothetical protein
MLFDISDKEALTAERNQPTTYASQFFLAEHVLASLWIQGDIAQKRGVSDVARWRRVLH